MRYLNLFLLCFFFTTTLYAQPRDTCDCNKNKPLLFPIALVAYGSLSIGKAGFPSSQYIKNQRDKYYPTFHNKADDYLVYAPTAMTFALQASGVKGRNNIKDAALLYTFASIINVSVVHTIKNVTRIMRPDNSTRNSFPSGHTSVAFGGAQLLHKEYGWRSPWYSIFGYTTAATSGSMRILNNRHWFSDVVVGAGVGMLSTELVYRWYPKIKQKVSKKKNAQPAF